jgi:hypothetical protein
LTSLACFATLSQLVITKTTIKRVFAPTLLSTIAGSAFSFELGPEGVKGVYSLAQPERSTAGMMDKLTIEYG